MAGELTMPKLSDSMADAVIIRWLKSPGDAFERGEGLIEVETDKATVVYEAESAGTLASILVPEGATAAVGDPIALLANGEVAASSERPRGARGSALRETAATRTPRPATGHRPGAPQRDAGGEADRSRARDLAARHRGHGAGRSHHG